MNKTDYCGIVSGKKVDKFGLFTVFRGEVTGTPMIEECRFTAIVYMYRHGPTPASPFSLLAMG